MLPRALGEDELIDALRGVSLLGIRSGKHVTGRVLDAAPELVAPPATATGGSGRITPSSRPGALDRHGRPVRSRARGHRAAATCTYSSGPLPQMSPSRGSRDLAV
jgi:hypothetical protein